MARFRKIGSRYEIKFKRRGKVRKHSLPASTSQRVLSKLEADMNQAFELGVWNLERHSWTEYVQTGGAVSAGHTPTFGYFKQLLLEQISERVMARTVQDYSYVLSRLLGWMRLEARQVGDINSSELTELFYEYIQAHQIAEHTAAGYKSKLKKLCDLINDQLDIELQLKKPKNFTIRRRYAKKDREAILYITYEQLQELHAYLDAIPRGYYNPEKFNQPAEYIRACYHHTYDILFHHAMRWVELERLSAEDVDLAGGKIILSGKGEKLRVIPVRSPAAAALEWMLQDDFELVRQLGYRRLKRRFILGLERMGNSEPRKGLHMLRHGGATHLLSCGFPLKELSVLMGHESIQQTEMYAKIIPSRLAQVVQNFDRGTFGVLKKVAR